MSNNSNSVSVVSGAFSFGEACFVLVENDSLLPSIEEGMITGETHSHLFVMVKGDVSPLKVENRMHVARTREALATALAFETDNCIHEHADRFLELSYGYLPTIQRALRLKGAKALADLTPSQLEVIAGVKSKAHSLVQPLYASLSQTYLHDVHVRDQSCSADTLKACLGILAKPIAVVAPLATAIVKEEPKKPETKAQPTKAETKPVTVSAKVTPEKPATLSVPSKRQELEAQAKRLLKESPKKAVKKPATL